MEDYHSRTVKFLQRFSVSSQLELGLDSVGETSGAGSPLYKFGFPNLSNSFAPILHSPFVARHILHRICQTLASRSSSLSPLSRHSPSCSGSGQVFRKWPEMMSKHRPASGQGSLGWQGQGSLGRRGQDPVGRRGQDSFVPSSMAGYNVDSLWPHMFANDEGASEPEHRMCPLRTSRNSCTAPYDDKFPALLGNM